MLQVYGGKDFSNGQVVRVKWKSKEVTNRDSGDNEQSNKCVSM